MENRKYVRFRYLGSDQHHQLVADVAPPAQPSFAGVVLDGRSAIVNGRRVPLTEDQALAVGKLIAARGVVAGHELCPNGSPHRFINGLPDAVRERIQSKRGPQGGFWLVNQ